MRRILITGGGRGIGAAAVCKFTSLGDKVAFVYRSDDARAKALSEKREHMP
jgi:NAD(P)-dependent dehydrogenase (short-subunit alcohol dehydrogenase family)